MDELVFLDRDGTINEKAAEGRYITSPDDFRFLPGAREGLRLLTARGFRLAVTTNQRGIRLGHMTEADLEAIHHKMELGLLDAGVRLDGVYHCPHDNGECECRKPGVGMLLRAQRKIPHTSLERSIMIGDSAADMEAGARAGSRLILVGPDREPALAELRARGIDLDYQAGSLLEAARWLCKTPLFGRGSR
jgi:D-glycero-D-manno-heptose 1,7-bisphosphate phosphatase